MEITTYFDKDCTLIVNSSCPMLTAEKVSGDYGLITVGTEGEKDYLVKDISDLGDKGIKFTLKRDHKEYRITLPVPGAHNAVNAALGDRRRRADRNKPGTRRLKGWKKPNSPGKRHKVTEHNGNKSY